MTALTLVTQGLLSKWGFNDGDMPDDVADAWDDANPDHHYVPVPWRDVVLPRLVREYVAPILDQKVVLTHIGTSHNPIRASTVDGVDVEDFWTKNGDAGEPQLTPDLVAIPMTVVLRMCRESIA